MSLRALETGNICAWTSIWETNLPKGLHFDLVIVNTHLKEGDGWGEKIRMWNGACGVGFGVILKGNG